MSDRDPEENATAAAPGSTNLMPTQAPTGAEDGSTADAGSTDEPANRRARRAAAARSRKERMREREEAEAIGLDAQEILDDALVRSTDSLGKWLKKNSSTLQWLVVGGLTVWAGWGLYDWRKAHSQAEASGALAKANQAQFAKVTKDGEAADEETRKLDPSPVFADNAARLAAAEAGYRIAAEENASAGTALYARLGLGGVLLDEGKADEAKAEFDKVVAAPVSKKDVELRCRALEGVAQALEAKGDKEAALAAYGTLASESDKSYGLMAQYNQARLQRDLGRIDEAKALVSKLQAALPAKEGLAAMFPGYLEQSVKTLANALGVEAPKTLPKAITAEQIRELAGSVQQKLNTGSGDESPAKETP